MISRSGRSYSRMRALRAASIRILKRTPNVHPTAYVHPTARVARDLVAHEYAFIGRGCEIDPQVRVGRYSMLAGHVTITGDDHIWTLPGTPIQFAGRPTQSPTVIEDDVWIGHRAIVMRGVTIGRGSIVAAQAVVTADVEPYTVVGGVPARMITMRFGREQDRQLHDQMLNGPLVPAHFADRLMSTTGSGD